MKIGIVGTYSEISFIEKYIYEYFTEVKTTKFEVISPDDTKHIISYLQVEELYFDGVIFSCKNLYDIVNHAMHSKNPWVYISRNNNHLQRLLLEISLKTKYDPLNISVDGYDEDTLLKAFDEVKILKKDIKYYLPKVDIFKTNFVEELKQQHRLNFYRNNVSVCITENSNIFEDFKKEGIPCVFSSLTKDDIKETVKKLKLKMRSRIDEKSQIVVLAIEIDLPNEYSIIFGNEYQIMSEKTKVTEKVYLFAQSIQGTVLEIGTRGYLIFSTKNILEIETNNLQHIQLLDEIDSSTTNTISMGIGYGVTAREANYNANLGMYKAKNMEGNVCYAVNEGIYTGPIKNGHSTSTVVKIDENYLRISEITSISIDTIYRIQCFIDQYKKEYCTPKELAVYLEISKRSVNRILEKLEYAGFIHVVGKKSQGGAGRPSRIVKISFKYETKNQV